MIARLKFVAMRALRDELGLSRISCGLSDLLAKMADQTVAIVGNSRALADQRYGFEIDSADIVIRINRAPMPSTKTHGQKTGWLALATSLSTAEEARIAPDRIIWMSHKRKRLAYRLTQRPGFYLHPLPEFYRLKDTLGAPPTTGLMLIDLVLRSQAKSIELFGFDFFSSLSLSGKRTSDRVPHDFDAERSWVTKAAESDRRLTINN